MILYAVSIYFSLRSPKTETAPMTLYSLGCKHELRFLFTTSPMINEIFVQKFLPRYLPIIAHFRHSNKLEDTSRASQQHAWGQNSHLFCWTWITIYWKIRVLNTYHNVFQELFPSHKPGKSGSLISTASLFLVHHMI